MKASFDGRTVVVVMTEHDAGVLAAHALDASGDLVGDDNYNETCIVLNELALALHEGGVVEAA